RAYILQQYVLVIAGCGVVFKFILLFSFYARGKDAASKTRYDQYTRVVGNTREIFVETPKMNAED
ncbi:MAG: hypothetical protein ACK5SJ_02485, partial [Bacteroidota bacterium]